MKERKGSVGVIVGRFQVSRLHDGHLHLIDFVRENHEDVLIVLGVPGAYPTARNPLSFELRKAMIQNHYPEVKIARIADHPSDKCWSKELDRIIRELFPGQKAKMYGSRDSCLDVYCGKLSKCYFTPQNGESGTKKRLSAAKSRAGREFLEGVIYSQTSRQPIIYPAVDVAVVNFEKRQALLAGKTIDGGKLRFIGGFVDPKDNSFEAAAKREVAEETSHIETANYSYIGSIKVDDWRYRGSNDGIMTNFYCASYIFGAPIPKDDIQKLEWVPYEKLLAKIVPEHKPLAEMLLPDLRRATIAR